jgi:choline dehydrogenase-like flavoprotein
VTREVPAGAVDADGRVHGTTNLYVAGPSVFQTGDHANPMLTIVALAFRLAAHLSAHLG